MTRGQLFRTLRQVHLWLSVATSLPLLILSVTGALLVFGEEIQSAVEPGWTVAPAAGRTPVTFEALRDNVARERPDVRIWSVYMPPKPGAAWRLWLEDGAGVLNVDPYTGEIVRAFRPKETLYGAVVGLHRWWLATGQPQHRWARHAVSVVTLLLIVQLAVGIWLWATPPNRLRRLKPEFGAGARLAVLRLHNLCGIVTALLVAVIAFTGMSLFWHDSTKVVVEALAPGEIAMPPKLDPASFAPVGNVDEAVAIGAAANPGMTVRSVQYPGRPGAPVALRLFHPDRLSGKQVWVGDDPARVVASFDPAEESAATWIWNVRFLFHVGTFGGWPVRLLWLLLSLAPAGFLISGLWLYFKQDGTAASQQARAAR